MAKAEDLIDVKTKKLRVLHIITRLIVGGAQENTIYTADLLDKDVYEVEVISGEQTGSEGSLIEEALQRGINLSLVPSLVRQISPFNDLVSLARLVRRLQRKNYDIVHTHSSKAGILGRWAAKIAGVPVIIHTVHGWGFHDYQLSLVRFCYTVVERLTATITHRIIAVTKRDIAKGLKARIGNKSKYSLIRSGIELEEFKGAEDTRSRLRNRLGLPPEAKVVGSVTRLSPQKSPLTFIQAAALILKQEPACWFVVVGDGPLRKTIERQAEASGIAHRLILTGLRRDVGEILHSFDVFMLTSLWEGLPRVIPQAMAAGVPVVASHVDGNAEIVRNNINGILVEPGSAEATAKAVTRLLDDPILSKKLTDRARRDVDEYSVHKMTNQINNLYLSLSPSRDLSN